MFHFDLLGIKKKEKKKVRMWSTLSGEFDFNSVTQSKGHAWEPHNPQVDPNFPKIQWAPRHLGWIQVSLCFLSDYGDGASFSPWAGEERPSTWKHLRLSACLHMEATIHQAGSCRSVRQVKSPGVCLRPEGCVCSVPTICQRDRWSLTVLFAFTAGEASTLPYLNKVAVFQALCLFCVKQSKLKLPFSTTQTAMHKGCIFGYVIV